MRYGGIILSAVVAASITICSGAFGSSIYFDVNSDMMADVDYTMGIGQKASVSVCLSGFTEQTGSFQFDVFYDGLVVSLIDYDTYMGQADEDPGLGGIIQTKAELGPWATSQWGEPVTQEVNEYDSGSGRMREFYTAGSLTETASGDGILAYLVLEGVGVGDTELDLVEPGGTWFLEGVGDQPVPINLTVHVIPEPSMWLLLPAAAIMARRLRRRR